MRASETHVRPYPSNASVYVLKLPEDGDFIAAQHLKIVYRRNVSDVVMALRN
jgi:hypothetical protein